MGYLLSPLLYRLCICLYGTTGFLTSCDTIFFWSLLKWIAFQVTFEIDVEKINLPLLVRMLDTPIAVIAWENQGNQRFCLCHDGYFLAPAYTQYLDLQNLNPLAGRDASQSSTFSVGSAAKPGHGPGDDLTPGKTNDARIKLILHGGKLPPFFNAF